MFDFKSPCASSEGGSTLVIFGMQQQRNMHIFWKPPFTTGKALKTKRPVGAKRKIIKWSIDSLSTKRYLQRKLNPNVT